MTLHNLKLDHLFVLLSLLFCNAIYATGGEDSSDFTIVVKDNSVIFDVLENDNIEGKVSDFKILDMPEYGKAVINVDNSVTYMPLAGVCDEIDEFTYIYKDANGLDTVSVFVEILCETITVINGFAPLGDDNPNRFTILGVENFPNNTLYIFNNNGNEIFYKEGYSNDWNGTDGGEPLPNEFIYYYVFNDGEGNTLSGYVQIN